MTETVNALANPDAANAMLAQALNSTGPAVKAPIIDKPPANEVTLPGGFLRLTGASVDVVRTAEVKEFDGDDEEKLSRFANNPARLQTQLLKLGVVSLGDKLPGDGELDDLLSGDRDAILLGLRRVNFGNDIEFTAVCTQCSTRQSPKVSIAEDIKTKTLEDPVRDRTWTLELPSGRVAQISLPTVRAQREVQEATDASAGRLKTLLLKNTVTRLNDMPTLGAESSVKKLSIADRDAILADIADRAPGPRLLEVVKPCENCGENIALPITLGGLFLF